MADARGAAKSMLLPDGHVLNRRSIDGRSVSHRPSFTTRQAARSALTGSMPPRARLCRDALQDGRVLVAGDTTARSLAQPSYTIRRQASSALPARWPTPPAGPFTATLLPDGRVLVAVRLQRRDRSCSASCTIGDWEVHSDRLDGHGPRDTHRDAAPQWPSPRGRGLRRTADLASARLYDRQPASSAQPARWPPLADGITATLLSDGRVLVAGGESAPSEERFAELYDQTGDVQRHRLDDNQREGHTATLALRRRVLVAGGKTASVRWPRSDLYDPKTGTFSPTVPMVTSRAGTPRTQLSDGRVLLAGGTDARSVMPQPRCTSRRPR